MKHDIKLIDKLMKQEKNAFRGTSHFRNSRKDKSIKDFEAVINEHNKRKKEHSWKKFYREERIV